MILAFVAIFEDRLLSINYVIDNTILTCKQYEPFETKSYIFNHREYGKRHIVELNVAISKKNLLRVLETESFTVVSESFLEDIDGYVIGIVNVENEFYLFYSREDKSAGSISVLSRQINISD